MELHGTGTALGDPTETSSLATVLTMRDEGPVAAGGAKGSFGHTMAASGLLGVSKLLLQLEHAAKLGNRHLRILNILVAVSYTHLTLPTKRIV